MKKIGIMGGTFNPVHTAHLLLAEQAYYAFALNQVMFLPAGKPPHKDNQEILSAEHRYNMLQEAIKGNSHFTLSDYEIKKGTVCYTADTMRELKELNPDTEFYFIIGGDSILEFDHWKRPEEILQYTNIVACGRSGNDNTKIQDKIKELNQTFDLSSSDAAKPADTTKKSAVKIQYFEVPAMEISSKMIRTFRKDGKSIRYFVPDSVYRYISKNQLYY